MTTYCLSFVGPKYPDIGDVPWVYVSRVARDLRIMIMIAVSALCKPGYGPISRSPKECGHCTRDNARGIMLTLES